MPYYHVRIVYTSAGTAKRLRCFQRDLSERFVKTKIAGPFNDGAGLRIDDKISEEDSVHDVAVFRSEQTFLELLHEVRRKYDLNADLDDVWTYLLEGKVAENVTNIFIRSGKTQEIESAKRISKNVFIVHGRDHAPMKELETMLYEFGLKPIILHEQPSGSRTVVEKLEKYSNVGYAFVILTPDDPYLSAAVKVSDLPSKKRGDVAIFIPTLNEEINWADPDRDGSWKLRARQNVVLEFGYFMGLLGRDRVCCLHKGNVELPSDMQGIVYIPFKNSINEVREMISKELAEAGYDGGQ